MIQIKIFEGEAGEVEKKTNDFLQQIPGENIIDINLTSSSETYDPDESNGVYSEGISPTYGVLIKYRDKSKI